eukprot:scaffold262033_cov21-Tisochrysis_lutea.AAC.1
MCQKGIMHEMTAVDDARALEGAHFKAQHSKLSDCKKWRASAGPEAQVPFMDHHCNEKQACSVPWTQGAKTLYRSFTKNLCSWGTQLSAYLSMSIPGIQLEVLNQACPAIARLQGCQCTQLT